MFKEPGGTNKTPENGDPKNLPGEPTDDAGRIGKAETMLNLFHHAFVDAEENGKVVDLNEKSDMSKFFSEVTPIPGDSQYALKDAKPVELPKWEVLEMTARELKNYLDYLAVNDEDKKEIEKEIMQAELYVAAYRPKKKP